MAQRVVDPKEWPLGTSSTLFRGGLTEQSLQECKAAGIQSLEFVAKADDPESERLYDELAVKARAIGIDVWSVHLPFGRARDISSTDPEIRETWIRKNVEIMKRGIGWGAKKAILHPSYEPIPDEERSTRMRHAIESLRVLGDEADNLGIQIAVECLPRTCLGNTSGEILTLVDAHPNLGICCDVNHLLKETPQDFIDAVGSKIVTLHISDYDAVDEKHWLPGRGVIEWKAVLGALARAGYQGPFMFEVSNRHTTDEDFVTAQTLAECWTQLTSSYEG